ncbi:MAG: hypothetical protein DBX59_11055 [Bacillota bacterium]|nr:MAG: hypothetical protein DBX59_11055 [Bacillota bacterium]
MVKQKKRSLLVLFALVAAVCCAFLAACNGKVNLVDFADDTVQCEYGDTYTLDLAAAKDDKGNEYAVTAEVRDADGERVGVFNNAFDIADIRGYTVKYTARSGEEIVGERTVSITVLATAKPNISFSAYSAENVYEVGKIFKLPSYTVSSPLTDNVTASAKLYCTEAEGETDISESVENSAFTPAKAGSYAYRVTADDGLGNTVSLTSSFEIRPAVSSETEIESFDHELSVKNVTTTTGELAFDSIAYCAEEIAGVTGSVKLGVSQKWPHLYVRSRQNIDVDKYPFIAFKIYIAENDGMQSTNKTLAINYPDMAVGTESPNTRKFIVQTGRWEDVYVASEHFNAYAEENGGNGFLFSFVNDTVAACEDYLFHDTFECYLADVRMSENNVPAENEILDVTSDTVLHNVHSLFDGQYHFGFDFELSDEEIGGNAETKLKLTNLRALADLPSFCVKPVRDLQYYTEKGYTHVLVSFYIDGTTLKEGKLSKNMILLPTPGDNFSFSAPADVWVNAALPIEAFFNARIAEDYITLFTVLSNENGWKDVGMTIYIGGINAIKAQAGGTEKLVSYDNSVYANLRAQGTANTGYKHSAAAVGCTSAAIGGKDGDKLLVEGPASVISLQIKPLKTLQEYYTANKDSIRFSMYVPAASLADGQTELNVTLPDGTQTKLSGDEWKTVDVRLDAFFAAMKGGYVSLVSYENLSGATKLYVGALDLVRLINEPTVTIGEIPEGNSHEIGRDFELPEVSAIGGTLTVTKKLFYKEGTEEREITSEISDGKFTPDEAGEYIYRITATDGPAVTEKEVSFKIRAAAAAGEVESFDDELSKKSVYNHSNPELGFNEVSYCSEAIGGISGSFRLELTEANKWGGLFLRPRQNLDSAQYPYIVFKIFISSETWAAPRSKYVSLIGGGHAVVSVDKWTELVVPAAAFFDSADDNGFCTLFSFVNTADASHHFKYGDSFVCYITDVRGVRENTPAENQIVDISADSSLQYIGTETGGQYNYGFTYRLTDENVGGRDGVKMQASYVNALCGYPTVTVKPINTKEYYADKGYTHIEISLFIERASVADKTTKTAFLCGVNGLQSKSVATGEWTTLTITLDDFYGSVGANGVVNLLIIYSEGEDKDNGMVMYIDGIHAVKE